MMAEVDFIIAQCPDCGSEVSTEDLPQPMRLFVAAAALMVHASNLHGIMQLPEYAGIKENWDERLEGITSQLLGEASDMQDFGEHYDVEADDGEEEDE